MIVCGGSKPPPYKVGIVGRGLAPAVALLVIDPH